MDRPAPGDSQYAPTPLPSTGARVAAFAAILVGGLCGGLIGFAFTDLQGASSLVSGIFAVLGAAIGAVGVGVVAVLALRAMGEWRAVEQRRGG
ncbi:MAG: hypothetical protein AB7L84_07760 [Acidimicrobiia bacterium]